MGFRRVWGPRHRPAPGKGGRQEGEELEVAKEKKPSKKASKEALLPFHLNYQVPETPCPGEVLFRHTWQPEARRMLRNVDGAKLE